LLKEEILADLLEASARRCPGQVALVYGDTDISYGELDRLAGPYRTSGLRRNGEAGEGARSFIQQ
jgi:non-ribosomal peptide synthetase component E (peptide arylation enzyme)